MEMHVHLLMLCGVTLGSKRAFIGFWTSRLYFDLSRVRAGYADHNFAILRRIALNLLRQEKIARSSIYTKRLKVGWNTDYLEKVLLGEDITRGFSHHGNTTKNTWGFSCLK